MQQLYELLYTSEIALEESPTCVASIIRVSRANNALVSVTGLLAFDGLHFCQYLEGPRDPVLRLADKIASDTRHILFEIQEQGERLGERRFPNWSMGYALSQDEAALPRIAKPDIKSPIERLQLLLPSLAHMLD